MSYAFTTSEASSLGCGRRHFFGYIVGLAPAVENTTLGKGRIWHSMTEAFWTTEPDLPLLEDLAEAKRLAAERVLDRRIEELRAPLASFDPQGGGTTYDRDELDELEAILRSMLEQYAARWSPDRWRVISVEEVFDVPVRTENGRKSPATRYTGRRDLVVEIDGEFESELWLVEMKSTGTALERWWLDNRYRPQVPRYAWSYQEQTGREVVGVIYDLALFAVAPTWESVTRTKPRGAKAVFSPGLSRQIPANMTLDVLNEAVDRFLEDGRAAYSSAMKEVSLDLDVARRADDEKSVKKLESVLWDLNERRRDLKPFADFKRDGETVDGNDFLAELRERLRTRTNPFVEEYRYRFLPGEVEATGEELYHTGTRIRRLHEESPVDRSVVVRALEEGGRERFEQVVSEIASTVANRYTRNGHECRKWGRPCPFLDLCHVGRPESARTLVPKGAAHVELSDHDEEADEVDRVKPSDVY